MLQVMNKFSNNKLYAHQIIHGEKLYKKLKIMVIFMKNKITK